ncbi:DNA-binding transcriptional regulator, MarR family [Sphingopyxis sp. YR583]|nr:DNA-binding transcriptional regulator, MarR family [Sphingopyxis sp. YR583]
MMSHMMRTLERSAIAPGGFGAGDAGPPEKIGGGLPAYIASRLLFVGTDADWPDAAPIAEVRRVRTLSPLHAADYIRKNATLDIVWLGAAETIASETFNDICAAASEQDCNLICETGLAALDRIVAAIPAALEIQFLVDPDPTDRLVALAAARRMRHGVLHDIARDDAMERIDRLQEEVARISRLLGDLASQRDGLPGTPVGFAPRGGEELADHMGQVRAPARDFAAIPRSFVPEERTLDRQRAKAVRRMLRQRRIREQYFPADLFADPAWDMLLDLYAARLERQPVSVSSLCIAAAVPATTALRWIKTMTDAGLFMREDDPHDGRRIFIALAEGAYDALARYFEALEE